MKKRLLVSILCSTMVIMGARTVGAQAILFVDDFAIGGLYDVLIMDNAAAGTATPFGLTTHSDPLAGIGVVSFSGAVGPGAFILNVTTGISKPLIGPNRIDLNSIDLSTAVGGTLRVGFADNGFTFGSGSATVMNEIGGTTDGTVTTQYFADPGNALFAGQFANQGPFGPGAFSGTSSFNLPGLGTPFAAGKWPMITRADVGPFSISEWATITHAGAGVTSFNTATSVVPEPTTLILVGAGLLGGGLLRRRKSS